MKTEVKQRPLKALAEAYRKDLRVNPEYQRGTKWSPPQKQSLIDSLLRGYDLPLFYVHLLEKTNSFTGTKETTVWLVDGQQRLAAIADYLNNQFALPDPKKETEGSVIPTLLAAPLAWHGKTFDELEASDKKQLLERELHVVYMTEETANEVRDLFIRLQAGTPLTAQEKRDAWPGEFTSFVIRHAGKPNHSESKQKAFFKLVCRGKNKSLTVDDGEHYVDGFAEVRKFFAGLAMTIMMRVRTGADFVDLKGKTVNDFYKANLDLPENDPAALRVIKTLDLIPGLTGYHNLLKGKPITFQLASHFVVLVNALDSGEYVPVWRDDVVAAFQKFLGELAAARLHHRKTREELPHYHRFAQFLSGSGSDTAKVIRRRHAFFIERMYSEIRIKLLDPKRIFDPLAKEVIWNRDDGHCKNPDCGRLVPFDEAEFHHIEEHCSGGKTILQNGILVCKECHQDRMKMQSLAPVFQQYLQKKTFASAQPSIVSEYE